MRYLPHTKEEISSMLATVGVGSISDLFSTIPETLRLDEPLNLPSPASEPDLMRELKSMAALNKSTDNSISFLGAGSYNHVIPACVWQLVGRGEFLTPYTPYQPEISQGTLQVIFEYQSMMSEIFAMEVVNASNYDCSTAVAEAVLMAERVTNRNEFILCENVHPAFRDVTETTLFAGTRTVSHISKINKDGLIDLASLKNLLNDKCAAIVVQYPSFFGTVEDLQPIADLAHVNGALLIVVVPDPISLGLLEAPGNMGADIVVAEGQPLGIPVNYGGPYVGIFATREKYVRQMPGRLAGLTKDADNKDGFVLTLSTREQHIRRERATSNICTNQQLCALAATIYTAWLGKEGLKQLSKQNWEKAEYAKEQLAAVKQVSFPFNAPTFHEFVIKVPNARAVLNKLKAENIFGGLEIAKFYPTLPDTLLICVTEVHRKQDIDKFAAALSAAI